MPAPMRIFTRSMMLAFLYLSWFHMLKTVVTLVSILLRLHVWCKSRHLLIPRLPQASSEGWYPKDTAPDPLMSQRLLAFAPVRMNPKSRVIG